MGKLENFVTRHTVNVKQMRNQFQLKSSFDASAPYYKKASSTRSGAGKSTMIKLILKEINPTSGSISVNGYNLNKLRRRRIPALRRTIGFVFQDFRLIPSMTVYENVAFVLRVIDAPTKYIRKRVPYVIGLVGLQDKTYAYPDELSGGEKQRVAIARALVNDPQLIIADEPTGNIDPELSYEIVELLQGINDIGDYHSDGNP